MVTWRSTQNVSSVQMSCLGEKHGRWAFSMQGNSKIPGDHVAKEQAGNQVARKPIIQKINTGFLVPGNRRPREVLLCFKEGASAWAIRQSQHCIFCFFPVWVAFIFRTVIFERPVYYLHHAKEMKGKVWRKIKTETNLKISWDAQ